MLPSLPSLPAHWTSLPMSNEQLSMYWGPHHLWGQGGRGQGGSKLKLAPLTPRSLPSLPSSCCHSHLAGPHSQCPMNSFLCIGVPTTSGGKGQGGSKLKLASLTPRSLPLLRPLSSSLPACSTLLPPPSSLQLAPSLLPVCSSLLPPPSSLQLSPSYLSAHSQLAPARSHLPACSSSLPAHSSLLPMGNVCVGVPTTSWV